MKTLALLFAVLLSLVGQVAEGEAPPLVAWEKHYGVNSGENGGDYCTSSVQTSDGGKLLLGYTYSGPYGQEDGFVIWVNASGTEIRRKFYGTDQYDYLVDGKQLPDGGFILVGTSNGNGWALRIDAQGNVFWDVKIGGTGVDAFNSVIPLPDGGFVAIGVSTSVPSGNKTSVAYGNGDGWVAWLDSQGNVIRDRSYGGDKTDQFTVGFRTSDGNLVFGGYSYSGVSGNKTSANKGGADYWFLSVNIDGATILRDKDIGGLYNDKVFDAFPTSDGGLVGVGYSYSGVSGDKTSVGFGVQDGWVAKLNPDWTVVSWDTTLGGTSDDFFNRGLQTPEGSIVVVGGSYSDVSGNKTSPNFGWEDGLIAKLNSVDGQILWDKSIGTTNSDGSSGPYNTEQLTGVQVNADGGIFVSGSSWAFTDGGFYTVQFYPPPHLSAVRADGHTTVHFSGPPGLYQIQASTNFTSWETVTTLSVDASGVGSFMDPQSSTLPLRFYRWVKME